MPKLSKDSAPQRQEAGPVVDLRDELCEHVATAIARPRGVSPANG